MLKPIFYTRAYTLNPFQAPWLKVEEACWSEIGGPDTARLSGWNLGRVDLAGALELLRGGVELADESGMACWWGYVEKIELYRGGTGAACSLEEMANRVKVSYISLDHQGLSFRDQRLETAWADNTDCQAIYGIKERILRRQESTLAQAEANRAVALAENGWPVARPALRRQAENPDLVITLKGWWHTAGWRAYHQAAGVIENVTDGAALQNLGSEASSTKIGQQVTLGPVGWRAETLWVRLCKIGSPGDGVRAAVYSDSGGSPGAALGGAAEIPAAAISTGYAWTQFLFATPPELAANTVYWLVLERTGGIDAANAYRSKFDSDASFTGGVFKYFDGADWHPRADITGDLVFRLSGGMETTEQIQLMAGADFGGQFLSGVTIEHASGVYTNPFRSGGATAQAEVTSQLAGGDADGGRLLCEVTRERALQVYAAPGPETAVLRINASGCLADERGSPLPAWAPAAGRWAILENPWLGGGSPHQPIRDRIFLRAVEYDPANGSIKPKSD